MSSWSLRIPPKARVARQQWVFVWLLLERYGLWRSVTLHLYRSLAVAMYTQNLVCQGMCAIMELGMLSSVS